MKKLVVLIGALIIALRAAADEPYPTFNMHRGVTSISQSIYMLHMTIFYVCVIIGVLVFTALIYALIHHRKSKGYVAKQFHEKQWVEITWALIPLLILIVLAIPASLVLVKMNDTQNPDLTIKITGYQWKWRYEYLDYGIDFMSNLATSSAQIYNKAPKSPWYLLEVDRPLVVPIHKKIRFVVTANDVIHSWWVPDLGIKRDGVPGFINESWARIDKPGVYRGQCAELCGVFHGYMPIVVIAKEENDFDQWIKAQNPSHSNTPLTNLSFNTLMKMGESAYNRYCSACHQVNGKGIPPLYPPLQADSVCVGHPISRHIDIILTGVPGTSMQAFAPQLTDTEIAAITTYERNAWGNNTGEFVQPIDVQKERKKLNFK